MTIVLVFVAVSIAYNTYNAAYLTVLTAVGSIWAGLTGAVVGFYFARAENANDEE